MQELLPDEGKKKPTRAGGFVTKVKKFKEEYKKKNLAKNISKQTKYTYTVKNQPNIKYAIMEDGTKKYRVSILRDGKILRNNG